jgi:hypothetical protein
MPTLRTTLLGVLQKRRRTGVATTTSDSSATIDRNLSAVSDLLPKHLPTSFACTLQAQDGNALPLEVCERSGTRSVLATLAVHLLDVSRALRCHAASKPLSLRSFYMQWHQVVPPCLASLPHLQSLLLSITVFWIPSRFQGRCRASSTPAPPVSLQALAWCDLRPIEHLGFLPSSLVPTPDLRLPSGLFGVSVLRFVFCFLISQRVFGGSIDEEEK